MKVKFVYSISYKTIDQVEFLRDQHCYFDTERKNIYFFSDEKIDLQSFKELHGILPIIIAKVSDFKSERKI